MAKSVADKTMGDVPVAIVALVKAELAKTRLEIRKELRREVSRLLGARKATDGAPPAVSADLTCGVAGCDAPYRSQGYCSKHYQRARKHGWPMPCPPLYVVTNAKRGRPRNNPPTGSNVPI